MDPIKFGSIVQHFLINTSHHTIEPFPGWRYLPAKNKAAMNPNKPRHNYLLLFLGPDTHMRIGLPVREGAGSNSQFPSIASKRVWTCHLSHLKIASKSPLICKKGWAPMLFGRNLTESLDSLRFSMF